MAAPAGFDLDYPLLRRRFGRAAASVDAASALAREVARRMDERLDYLKIEPRRIVDLGCGTGADLARLGERFPVAQRLGVDFAPAMLTRAAARGGLLEKAMALAGRRRSPLLACADARALPLAAGSVSMVWSNLALNWLADPAPAFAEIHRVLETGGVLMFSTLGPDTLKELRAALSDAAGDRVHRFIDMHDLGDTLVRAGFADPVMDMEILTLTYGRTDDLFHDLRRAGCNNASTRRPRGLSGRTGWAGARAALEDLRRDGRLPATFEIIQGHAWKAPARTAADGRAIVRFESRTPRIG